MGRRWMITVWAKNDLEAWEHCKRHGMQYDGRIIWKS
jgi:hypothetical protein